MPCDVWKLANVLWWWARSQTNLRQFAEIVIICVRGERIVVKDIVKRVARSQSLVVTNRIANRTRRDVYSGSGVPRSVVPLNEIVI